MSNLPVILKKSDAEEYGKILTRELRSILKELGHYRTGKLDRSIKFGVTVNKTLTMLKINFYGEHYWKYLEDKDRMVTKLENSHAFKKIMQDFEQKAKKYIEDDIIMTFKQLKK